MTSKMYEICEYVEAIREEKNPQEKQSPLNPSIIGYISKCKNIWEECKDEIPHKSAKISCASIDDTEHSKYSRKEAEYEIR